MNAGQIMSRRVITTSSTMSARDVAKLLIDNRISALPVLDEEGALIGVVSEGDLLRPRDVAHDYRQSWWLHALSEGEELAAEFLAYVRSGDRKVGDLMTRELVVIEETTPVADIARLFDEHHIKRVPVVRDGKLVGIVSRADLVRTLIRREQETARPPQPGTPYEISRPSKEGQSPL